MEKTAYEIQKERTNQIEIKAASLLKFHTIEATFWIEGKFRTCKYK